MTFREKLVVLVENMNKSKVSRRAGISPSGISNYIAKTGSIPRADIAARIAKVLGVSVDWMLDDTQGFPAVRVESTPQNSRAAA